MSEKDDFFENMKKIGVSLTFDDVRLKTGYSKVMPDDVSIESKFSRNIPLKIPIVSAAMSTVTEHKMAIGMAMLGGLGIIHRNMSIDEQVSEVERVKFYLNGLIEKPICVKENDGIESIINMKNKKGYSFSTFPVLDNNKRIVGLITGNDIDFCDNYKLKAKDIMTKENDLIKADPGTSIEDAYRIMKENKKKVLPLTDNNNVLVGLYLFSDVKRIASGESSRYNIDDKGQLIVGAAVGTGKDSLDRVVELVKKNVDVVVIDTAHGDSKPVYDILKKIKNRFPDLDVVVGNISEPESAERLAKAGADGIKVGQGPGSICTTRIVAGIGCPQVTAVYNCSKIADEYNIPVCADGGIKYSGDITIAIGVGAHSVMLGNLLAGTDEAPGEIVFEGGVKRKEYMGEGSLAAMKKYKGSRERYRVKQKIIPEGVKGLVPYKGPLERVIFYLIGGLRSGMGYVGAASIEELREKADFRRITSQGMLESHPRIKITGDTPNY